MIEGFNYLLTLTEMKKWKFENLDLWRAKYSQNHTMPFCSSTNVQFKWERYGLENDTYLLNKQRTNLLEDCLLLNPILHDIFWRV